MVSHEGPGPLPMPSGTLSSGSEGQSPPSENGDAVDADVQQKTQDVDYHALTHSLLAAQLRQALHTLAAHHESALHLLSDRYSISGATALAYGNDDQIFASVDPGVRASICMPATLSTVPKALKTNAVQHDQHDDPPTPPELGTAFDLKYSSLQTQAMRKNDRNPLLDIWREVTRHASVQEATHTTWAHGGSASVGVWAEHGLAKHSRNTQVSQDQDTSKIFENESCCSRLIVHPYNPKRGAWDVSSLFLVLYDMIMIPMAFFEPDKTTFIRIMIWVTRLFWTADIVLSFLSGFVSVDGTAIELRSYPIAMRYLRTWFIIDAIVVSVDWIELFAEAAAGAGVSRVAKVSRVFRIVRMIRLLRLAKMKEVFTLLTERFDSEKIIILLDVFKLSLFMSGSSHFLACLWYAIAKAEDSDRNWLTQTGYDKMSLESKYLMALRWALAQFAGGMDEVTPYSIAENVYTVFVYLLAFWIGAVFVSILTSSMTNWYIIGSQNSQQLTTLRRYLSQNGISRRLAVRVQRNAHHSLKEQQRTMPEESVSLIGQVSEPLRVEIHFEMYTPVLSLHPFFAHYTAECPHVIRRVCHSAMSISFTSIGDIIFNKGEIPARPRMFIVTAGALQYSHPVEGMSPVECKQWIAEAFLWVHWVHCGTAIATHDTSMHALDAKEFQSIVGQFEHIMFDPRSYAIAFAEGLNKQTTPTDLYIDYSGLELAEDVEDDKKDSKNRMTRRFSGILRNRSAGIQPSSVGRHSVGSNRSDKSVESTKGTPGGEPQQEDVENASLGHVVTPNGSPERPDAAQAKEQQHQVHFQEESGMSEAAHPMRPMSDE